MSRPALWVALLLGLGGCAPQVIIGADVAKGCPAEPWATASGPLTAADVEAGLLGSWIFCGGQRRATGRGGLLTFYGGDGLEFWEAGDGLHYAFLIADGTAYRRTGDAWALGTVQLELAGVDALATLHASDGVDTEMSLTLFAQPRALRDSSFDVWNFVPPP